MFAHTELCFGVKNEHRARHKAQTHARRPGNVREDSSKALKISAAVRSTQILQTHHKESWPGSQFLFDFKKKEDKNMDGIKRTVENFLYLSVASG